MINKLGHYFDRKRCIKKSPVVSFFCWLHLLGIENRFFPLLFLNKIFKFWCATLQSYEIFENFWELFIFPKSFADISISCKKAKHVLFSAYFGVFVKSLEIPEEIWKKGVYKSCPGTIKATI